MEPLQDVQHALLVLIAGDSAPQLLCHVLTAKALRRGLHLTADCFACTAQHWHAGGVEHVKVFLTGMHGSPPVKSFGAASAMLFVAVQRAVLKVAARAGVLGKLLQAPAPQHAADTQDKMNCIQTASNMRHLHFTDRLRHVLFAQRQDLIRTSWQPCTVRRTWTAVCASSCRSARGSRLQCIHEMSQAASASKKGDLHVRYRAKARGTMCLRAFSATASRCKRLLGAHSFPFPGTAIGAKYQHELTRPPLQSLCIFMGGPHQQSKPGVSSLPHTLPVSDGERQVWTFASSGAPLATAPLSTPATGSRETDIRSSCAGWLFAYHFGGTTSQTHALLEKRSSW